MFGIDFSELMVCALVALVVIGPKRMPEAVRTTGLWIGRLKRSLHETREQVERQIGLEDVRRQLHTEEMMRTLDDMNEEIESALNYDRQTSKERADNNAKLTEGSKLEDATSPPPNSIQTSTVVQATVKNP
jgi:sec-independent protein translocase protein TatB